MPVLLVILRFMKSLWMLVRVKGMLSMKALGGFSQTSMAVKYDGAGKRHRKVVESAYNSYAAVKGKE